MRNNLPEPLFLSTTISIDSKKIGCAYKIWVNLIIICFWYGFSKGHLVHFMFDVVTIYFFWLFWYIEEGITYVNQHARNSNKRKRYSFDGEMKHLFVNFECLHVHKKGEIILIQITNNFNKIVCETFPLWIC